MRKNMMLLILLAAAALVGLSACGYYARVITHQAHVETPTAVGIRLLLGGEVQRLHRVQKGRLPGKALQHQSGQHRGLRGPDGGEHPAQPAQEVTAA